jgi:DNA-binding NarL/FixJ family response regulator
MATGMNATGAPTLRVVIADDQAAVREGLVTLLDLLPDVEIVGAAADGEQAFTLVEQHTPDVVLMDLRMPRLDGIEATRRIHAQHPTTQVVVLTTYADDTSILDALHAGALGYLTKDAGRDHIARALHTAAAGHAVLDPAVHARLLAAATNRRGPDPDVAAAAPTPLPDSLTPREAEVLGLIAAGLSNSRIARRLFISEATVKTHINHLFAKTGATDRAQAVSYAYRLGLIHPEPHDPR